MKHYPVYKGLTRPAMALGLPYRYLISCIPLVAATWVVFIDIRVTAIAVGIMWTFGKVMVNKDIHLMNILRIKYFVVGTAKSKYWKCRSYNPS